MNLNKKNEPQNNPKIGGETSQTEAGKRDKEMKEYQLKWTACKGKWSEAENSFIRGASKDRKRKGTKQKPVKTKGADTTNSCGHAGLQDGDRRRSRRLLLVKIIIVSLIMEMLKKDLGLAFFKARAFVCGAHPY